MTSIDVRARIKHLVEDVSRHGQVRLYVRQPGKPKIRLHVSVEHPDFLEHYRDALAGLARAAPRQGVTSVRVDQAKPGTFRSLCEAYMASGDFKRKLKPIGQRTRRGLLEHCWHEETKPGSGLRMGDCPVPSFGPGHVRTLRDRKADLPEAGNNRVKAIRSVFAWACETNDKLENPARKVKLFPTKGDGFHSWSLDEVARFEARHPIGTQARLAFDLLLYTAQRRSDIVLFGRQHVDAEGWLTLTQGKTGTKVELPVIAPLALSIAAAAPDTLQFLVTAQGRPFTANGFGNKFREWCDQAGLPKCSAHGLRKATAARLAELGCSEDEIGAITGHLTSKEIGRYTKAARRRVLAESAMAKLSASLDRERKSPTSKLLSILVGQNTEKAK